MVRANSRIWSLLAVCYVYAYARTGGWMGGLGRMVSMGGSEDEVDDIPPSHFITPRNWTELWPNFKFSVLEPRVKIKLRKRFYPLRTCVTLGADYIVQLGVWQFRSSWEDNIIGGSISVKGKELHYSKNWLFSLGEKDEFAARVRFRSGVDVTTGKAFARVGIRTERMNPLNLGEGVSCRGVVPLDGSQGHAKLQFLTKISLPVPELEYNLSHRRIFMGAGDIRVSLEELNFLLEY